MDEIKNTESLENIETDYKTFGENFFNMYYGDLEVPSETKNALVKSFSLAYALGLNKGMNIVKDSLEAVINKHEENK